MKPIFFNTEMVKAILAGEKNVTRRVVKAPWYIDDEDVCRTSGLAMHRGTAITHGMPYPARPYSPGDILYVRETWMLETEQGIPTGGYIYRASDKPCPDGNVPLRWRPSIHMPKEAARLFLRVTDVRVERLQEPFFRSGTVVLDCQAEGIDIGDQCRECMETYGNPPCISEWDGDDESDGECGILDGIRGDFSDLWDSTIQKKDLHLYGWAANPWVWVIEFEQISKEVAMRGGGEE